MTVKRRLESSLENMGMFTSQAEEVIKLAIPELNKVIPDYSITWDSPYTDYPDTLYMVMMVTIKPIALKWIEKNAPEAWFKPMFE